MAAWTSRGLRGSVLEDLINQSNEKYAKAGLALVQKIPTPIVPLEMDKEKGQIRLAYFDKKSTVDYMGVVQGWAVCFDAKECAGQRFSLDKIHDHQMVFMRDFEKQGGISFFLIWFASMQVFAYVPFQKMDFFWSRARQGGRKSFRMEELEEAFFFRSGGGLPIPYLELLQKDLLDRQI